jgi:hypothetical protein
MWKIYRISRLKFLFPCDRLAATHFEGLIYQWLAVPAVTPSIIVSL